MLQKRDNITLAGTASCARKSVVEVVVATHLSGIPEGHRVLEENQCWFQLFSSKIVMTPLQVSDEPLFATG